MHLVIPIKEFDISNIFFLEKTKNNILNGGDFYRVLYSTNSVTLNGIFLLMTLKITKCENYFNKIKCHLEPNKNTEYIETIKKLEKSILSENFEVDNFENDLQITQQLESNTIKLINDFDNYDFCNNKHEISVVLKISGIWTSGDKCGLTFRFFLTHL